jgi:hypothetical protein
MPLCTSFQGGLGSDGDEDDEPGPARARKQRKSTPHRWVCERVNELVEPALQVPIWWVAWHVLLTLFRLTPACCPLAVQAGGPQGQCCKHMKAMAMAR